MDNKRKALGKGLEQLFSNERIDFESFENDIISSAKEADIAQIPLDEIRSNPYQPRKTFDEEKLKELAVSIKEHGIIQPIILKKSIKGYELIAGERRTRASKIAGLKTIPAIIKDFSDNEMMEIALLENIQREDLNPIEEALAFATIIKRGGITQEDLAYRFGKSRSHITNLLGLLRLPDSVQKEVARGKLSMGHARVLSKLKSPEEIESISKKVIEEKLSVRDIEVLTSGEEVVKSHPLKKTFKMPSVRYSIYENVMRDKIGTKVKISNRKIEIPFDSEKDLERILEILNIEIEGE